MKCLLDSNFLKGPSGQSWRIGLSTACNTAAQNEFDIRQIKVIKKYKMTILYNDTCRQSLTLWLPLSCHRYRAHRSTTFPSHASREDDLTAPIDRRCSPRYIKVPILDAFSTSRSRSPSLRAVRRLRRTGYLCLLPGVTVIIVGALTEMRGRTTGTRVAVMQRRSPAWLEYGAYCVRVGR